MFVFLLWGRTCHIASINNHIHIRIPVGILEYLAIHQQPLAIYEPKLDFAKDARITIHHQPVAIYEPKLDFVKDARLTIHHQPLAIYEPKLELVKDERLTIHPSAFSQL